MRRVLMSTMVMVAGMAAVAGAQDAGRTPAASRADAARSQQQVREARYQIGQMERLLEGAVEHGATAMRDRLQAVMPADMLLTDNARARGFRLDGYGVFFDVEVPDLGGSLAWSLRTLDQNDLGLDAALQTLRQAAGNDVNLQQALKRVELQMSPMGASMPVQSGGATAVQASGSVPAPAAPAGRTIANDPVLHEFAALCMFAM
jgi:hypothetical protein